jgi:hypothetical protein
LEAFTVGRVWKAGIGWVDERATPLEQQFQYYWENAPRILRSFSFARAQIPEDVRFDGHGEELNTVFKLSCICGSPLHTVLGHHVQNEWKGREITVFVGPLLLRCEACGKQSPLLDTAIQGYDRLRMCLMPTSRIRATTAARTACT